MDDTYLIDAAAEYVGMSRRTFERLNISYQEEFREAKDGKKRKVRVYNESELDRIKADRERVSFKPSLVTTTSESPGSQVVTVSDLQMFAGLVVEAFQKENQKLLASGEDKPGKKLIEVSSFKDKLILNFSQALAYSGLPEDDLKKALKDKKILAKKTSENGTWKIYRSSLDEFCKSYFDEVS
jgi:hypothetical protein